MLTLREIWRSDLVAKSTYKVFARTARKGIFAARLVSCAKLLEYGEVILKHRGLVIRAFTIEPARCFSAFPRI